MFNRMYLPRALVLLLALQPSCILCDKDICIIDSGYRWCLSMAGAYGSNSVGDLENIAVNGEAIQGCVCLSPDDNAVLDSDHDGVADPKQLDPNTAYYTLLDGIRLEATKACQERAAEQVLTGDNCHALAKSRMEDIADGQPAMLAKDCELTADEAKVCGKTSTTEADGGAAGPTPAPTRAPPPTSGPPSPPTSGD
jgi:hypothetical protein